MPPQHSQQVVGCGWRLGKSKLGFHVTFREESAQAAELYETFFDRSIHQGERDAVIQTVCSTWSIDQARASLRVIIRFGFERLALNRIQALVMRDNRASVQLLHKLGFQEEGILREKKFFKG